jgi:hypothetical protein
MRHRPPPAGALCHCGLFLCLSVCLSLSA